MRLNTKQSEEAARLLMASADFLRALDATVGRVALLCKIEALLAELPKAWQDEGRTETNVERVYKTRIDCEPVSGGARE